MNQLRKAVKVTKIKRVLCKYKMAKTPKLILYENIFFKNPAQLYSFFRLYPNLLNLSH
jgi:hypothetical protein